VKHNPNFRIDCACGIGCGLGLEPADIGGAVCDLALEIGQTDFVEIDNADGADTGCCKVEDQWTSKSAGPDDQHPGGGQPRLPCATHLPQYDVTGVTLKLKV
jgi:hypothetical protein